MKLYIVITPFFPTPTSFYGPFIYDQVKALQRAGKNVIVFRPTKCGSKSVSYKYGGITVHCFPVIEMPSYILNGLTDSINKQLFKKYLRKYLPNNSEIEAVHCHTAQCAVYGIVVKEHFNMAKMIIQYHDPDPITILNGRFSDKKWNLLYKIRKTVRKLELFDIHVSVSRRVEENLLDFPIPSLREHYKPYCDILRKIPISVRKINIKQSVILINGVNTEKFFPVKKNESQNFTIGCVGNYIKWKNQTMLIDAVEILKNRGFDDVRLKLVGNNPHKEFQKIKEYVAIRGMDSIVEFCPPCDHSQLNTFYNTLDLFVLPSLFEGFGCVFTEAYACGVPFISCRDQGIEDIIAPSERDKWLVCPNAPEELAEKIMAYKEKCYPQILIESIDINVQIQHFLKTIDLL